MLAYKEYETDGRPKPSEVKRPDRSIPKGLSVRLIVGPDHRIIYWIKINADECALGYHRIIGFFEEAFTSPNGER